MLDGLDDGLSLAEEDSWLDGLLEGTRVEEELLIAAEQPTRNNERNRPRTKFFFMLLL